MTPEAPARATGATTRARQREHNRLGFLLGRGGDTERREEDSQVRFSGVKVTQTKMCLLGSLSRAFPVSMAAASLLTNNSLGKNAQGLVQDIGEAQVFVRASFCAHNN